jgi:hypothetical protein
MHSALLMRERAAEVALAAMGLMVHGWMAFVAVAASESPFAPKPGSSAHTTVLCAYPIGHPWPWPRPSRNMELRSIHGLLLCRLGLA